MSIKRIVCMSDLHGQWYDVQVPDGDLLIIAGDNTVHGNSGEYRYFDRWLGKLPHRYKVVIAGNHDKKLYYMPAESAQRALSNCIYLYDREVELEGIRIYGSPWTPIFMKWYFMKDRGPDIRKKWDLIPDGIDILVTHGPPIGYGDFSTYKHARMGCEELRAAVDRIRPKLHVFGHNHGGAGEARNEHTLFVNASVLDEGYNPVHKPIVIDWPIDLWA